MKLLDVAMGHRLPRWMRTIHQHGARHRTERHSVGPGRPGDVSFGRFQSIYRGNVGRRIGDQPTSVIMAGQTQIEVLHTSPLDSRSLGQQERSKILLVLTY